MKVIFSLGIKHKCQDCNGTGYLEHHDSMSAWPSKDAAWIKIPCWACDGTGRITFKKL